MAPHAKKNAKLSLPERGALGASAGICTTFFTHSFDVVRVQMQIDSEGGKKREFKGFGDAVRKIYARGGGGSNGVRALYSGLTAAWLRQVTYGSGRMGVYSWLMASLRERSGGKEVPFYQKLGAGMFSGGVGSIIGNPSEIALVRMGADAKLPPEQRRGYTNSLNCVFRMAREEGVASLWRGAAPTVIRASVINACLLGITSELKPRVASKMQWEVSSMQTIGTSALVASFFANIAAMPFDVIKSRMQNMQAGTYSGMADCARKSIAAEGPLVLWAGFTPAFIKLAPYTMISLTFLEKFTLLYTGGSVGAL